MVAGGVEWEGGMTVGHRELLGSGTVRTDTIMVNTRHYAFGKTHGIV